VALIIPINRGVERSITVPRRFSDKFFEKRGPAVEKFFMDSQ
jgi:hypothetical protein